MRKQRNGSLNGGLTRPRETIWEIPRPTLHGGGGTLRSRACWRKRPRPTAGTEGATETETRQPTQRSGNLVARYTYAPGYIDAVAVQEKDLNGDGDFADTSEVVYYHSNSPIFSVYALTDADENVVERYRYDAYGEASVLDADGSADADGVSDVLNPYVFTGRRRDLETGELQYRNRNMAPLLGRFINRDALQHVDGPNTYEYVGGAPASRIDPSGLATVRCDAGKWYWAGHVTSASFYLGYSYAQGSFVRKRQKHIATIHYVCDNGVSFAREIYHVPTAAAQIRLLTVGLSWGGSAFAITYGEVSGAPTSVELGGPTFQGPSFSVSVIVVGLTIGTSGYGGGFQPGLEFSLDVAAGGWTSVIGAWMKIKRSPLAYTYRRLIREKKCHGERIDRHSQWVDNPDRPARPGLPTGEPTAQD